MYPVHRSRNPNTDVMVRCRNPSWMRLFLAGLIAMALLGGCAGPRGPGSGPGTSPSVYQRGEAGYYAASFNGHPTASGEIYHPSRLTAAHRSLPMGSRVRVTNQDNGRSVVVRINDRGPYTHGRIIDLSRRAAKRLRMRQAGVVPVTLEVLSRP